MSEHQEPEDDVNPWTELARNGLTRPDQIPDMKNWLARRQAALDQLRKRWDAQYNFTCPTTNEWRLNEIEAAQFRLDFDRWQMEEFIKYQNLEEGES